MSTPPPGTVGVVLRGRPWWRHPADTLIAWGSRSTAVHAFVVVDGVARIVEAQPEGARIGSTAEYPAAVYSTWALSDPQRAAVAAAALALVGTPYNWWDDVCLGLARRFGVHLPAAVRRRLADPTHLQCAQLVDLAYGLAGVELFRDGRLSGDVTPGDLLDLMRTSAAGMPTWAGTIAPR